MTKENRVKLFAANKAWQLKKYPTQNTIIYTPKSENKANGLTSLILDWLKFNGCQAERISVVSRQVHGNFIKSNMTKGTADISATIPQLIAGTRIGRSVKIEVKIGADRMSEQQIRYKQNIEASGGMYFIARHFDEFMAWYEANFI
jgi:hypothetical protein